MSTDRCFRCRLTWAYRATPRGRLRYLVPCPCVLAARDRAGDADLDRQFRELVEQARVSEGGAGEVMVLLVSATGRPGFTCCPEPARFYSPLSSPASSGGGASGR